MIENFCLFVCFLAQFLFNENQSFDFVICLNKKRDLFWLEFFFPTATKKTQQTNENKQKQLFSFKRLQKTTIFWVWTQNYICNLAMSKLVDRHENLISICIRFFTLTTFHHLKEFVVGFPMLYFFFFGNIFFCFKYD